MEMIIMNLLNILLLASSVFAASPTDQQRKVHIVYMGSLPDGEYSPTLHHTEIIKQNIDPSFASKALIKSYKRSFNGFVAFLTEEEKQKLSSVDGVLSVFPSQEFQRQTTRSWDFVGLPRRIERQLAVESDIIIGVIDTGIWPESESFSDEGLGPVPKRWKGECAGGKNFTCNKKLIGARSYITEMADISARDKDGHGSHVASIAAGKEVRNANFFGLASGISRGGVPAARLAAYKVCEYSCSDIAILSAFDDSIADGVDIICISLTQFFPLDLTADPVAIGAFHAMQSGILTVSAAGNLGPGLHSVRASAPWILTVAASDTDRSLADKVLLGDGSVLMGTSVNPVSSSKGALPLVYGKEVTNNCSEKDAQMCVVGCLESSRIRQKVVMCDNNAIIELVTEAGASGVIIPDPGSNFLDVKPLPVAYLHTNDINKIRSYKNSSKNPEAKIFRSEAISNPSAPRVATFSSRGPSMFTPDILKPDVTAPGVEILAAFSPLATPSGSILDKRSVKFNILSGTSIACPHVVAAAAYVKSFHPTWSPSAIKSALMTTARKLDPKNNFGAELGYGSGHVDPVKAKDPGLVYETSTDDYTKTWCHISKGFGNSSNVNVSCPENLKLTEINYPSMAVQVQTKSGFVVDFPRVVTNVGRANSTYVATIKGNPTLHIVVRPDILNFASHNENISFVVTVRGLIKSSLATESAELIWTDGVHKVRSPIVVIYSGTAVSRGEKLIQPGLILYGICTLFVTAYLLL